MSGITRIAKEMHGNTGVEGVTQEPTYSTFESLVEEIGLLRKYTSSEWRNTHSFFSRSFQHVLATNNDGLEVFKKVFSKDSSFVPQIKQIIGSYIPEEAGHLIHTSKPYRDFFISPFAIELDFSRRDVLKNYLGKQYQTDDYIDIAAFLSTSIFEVKPRKITGYFGMAFCMYPEVLAYAMQLLQKNNEKGKKIAVEIGAASGENAALLAFTDVDQVYVNEMDYDEIAKFERLKTTLPKDINKKLKTFEGNCLDLLEKNPCLSNTVDLVICRNVIHFLNSKEQSQLFDVLKRVLKPGGRAIFSANATSSMQDVEKVFKKHPETTCFKLTRCQIVDLSGLEVNYEDIFYKVSICPMSSFSNEFQAAGLYERDPAQFSKKWQVDNDSFNKISSKGLRTKIKKAIENQKDYMKTIKKGIVVVKKSTIQAFNEESLSRLFKMAGFEIETTFSTDALGHLRPEWNKFNVKQQVGVVFRKPLVSDCPP